MARTMCAAVAFLLATAVVHANQCSSGDECPSGNEPKNIMSLLQTKHQMNVFKDGWIGGTIGKAAYTVTLPDDSVRSNVLSTSNPQADASKRQSIKLIVNSDVRYSGPLQTLFASLKRVSFNRWNNVVVMRGSASSDSDPFTPDTQFGKLGVKYIDLKLSSFDYHGFSGLHRHRNDPSVKADVYFYIHDTSLANSTFPSKFDSMASTDKFEARHPPFPFNNMCVFGSGVVDAYGSQFDIPVTKQLGADIELGNDSWFWKGRAARANVVQFAKTQTLLEKKQVMGYGVDVWHTGFPRGVVYFPSYGLTKYVLWGRHGDLTGNIQGTLQ